MPQTPSRLDRRSVLALGAGAAAGLLPLARPRAQTPAVTIEVQYPIPNLFSQVHEEIARAFMAARPDIAVRFRAPYESYEDGLQKTLRDAITGTLPDVSYQGLSRQRTLVERGIPVKLGPFIAAEPEWNALGFSPQLLSLGEILGDQYGIGFSLSTPVLYYNLDLVEAAGGNADALPASWDEVIALAARIHDPARNITGMHFDWTITGNWSWQALVFSHGGTMLTADERRVAFTEEPGRHSIRMLRRFVDDGRMQDIGDQTMFQDFFAGRIGIMMQSTAQLGRANREIAGRFRLKTGRFPLSAPAARLPAGGNAVMMLTRDEARQRAAWDYIKFACGPQGATIMVNGTGYMPATTVPAEVPELLGRFYAENPNHLTSIHQLPVLTGWYAFPGQNALRITDVIKDGLQRVVNRSQEPDAALQAIGADVQRMLPAT